ncbi:hypothetical protein HYT23_02660, partial [Candidatus Pacearchaeota archaeon]|nr:hypothetical protein [Candidatus Pacearchaeota archaeon]
ASGRFTSPDPISGGIGNPQSLNKYAYVLNNPNKFVDPSGMQEGEVYGPPTPKQAIIFVGDLGDFKRGVKDVSKSVENLKKAYEKEGLQSNVILGFQSSEETKEPLEEALGVSAISTARETFSTLGTLLGQESVGVFAFVGHSFTQKGRSSDYYESYGKIDITNYVYSASIPLSTYGEGGNVIDVSRVDYFGLASDPRGKMTPGWLFLEPSNIKFSCEIYGCGLVESNVYLSSPSEVGYINTKGLELATAMREKNNYRRIVNFLTRIADENPKSSSWFNHHFGVGRE